MSETLRSEVASLIVETLNLEVEPKDIVPDQPLFREGLGLDSIDALELAMAISQQYGFQLRSDNENNDKAAINSLQAFINAVEAQSGKKISQEDADNLIAAAQQIINILSSE